VGTGFRRDALEKLAAAFQNRIFDPEALTEDYANGHVLVGMQASLCAFVPQPPREGFRCHARVLPKDLAHRSPATVAMGHRNRASGLEAIRVGRHGERDLMAVAGPQRPDRKSAEFGRWPDLLATASPLRYGRAFRPPRRIW